MDSGEMEVGLLYEHTAEIHSQVMQNASRKQSYSLCITLVIIHIPLPGLRSHKMMQTDHD